MPATHTKVYIHLVWGTWDRLPLLVDGTREAVFACIVAECRDLRTEVIAVGGVADHVHLLVRLPATVCLSHLMNQVKGASAHLANHVPGASDFRWQGGYGAYSVSDDAVPGVAAYVRQQRSHHADGTIRPEWEPE